MAPGPIPHARMATISLSAASLPTPIRTPSRKAMGSVRTIIQGSESTASQTTSANVALLRTKKSARK